MSIDLSFMTSPGTEPGILPREGGGEQKKKKKCFAKLIMKVRTADSMLLPALI